MPKKFKKWFKKHTNAIGVVVGLSLFAISIVGLLNALNDVPEETAFPVFLEEIEAGNIKEVAINTNQAKITYTDKEDEVFITDNPRSEGFKREMLEADVTVVEKSDPINIFSILMPFLPIVIMVLFLKSFMNKQTSTPTAMSPAIVSGLDFDTVAGNEEAKEEMKVLVNFLKEPQRFKDKGATLPKGAIFYGPPGTGKTLMARAVAGEAGVPFVSISGSDFVELYVGTGAKRVRSLFKQARKAAPCIIFIDEIDAVGSSRSGEQNSEYKQTINALLNEMDGFNKDEKIIVIAATNRLEDLDSALIRPGRFDKQVAINIPDRKDRLAILEVHAKDKELAQEVSLESWASTTVGFSGAELAAMMNEATILSVINEHEGITNQDLDDAHYKIVMKGNKKKNQKDRNNKELEIVAWHEAGHALLAKNVAKQSVPKVSILSSTSGAGGVTFITPNDNNLPSKVELEQRIQTLYGGRIAESLLLEDDEQITAGASQDIKEATRLIRLMLTEFGMSDGYGMINPSVLYGKADASSYLLEEAKFISNNLYEEARVYLTEHVEELREIAEVLLEKESIDEIELDAILNKKLVA